MRFQFVDDETKEFILCDHHHDETCYACIQEAMHEERQRAIEHIKRLLNMVVWRHDDERAVQAIRAAQQYIVEAEP
jgi:hypothetical protein